MKRLCYYYNEVITLGFIVDLNDIIENDFTPTSLKRDALLSVRGQLLGMSQRPNTPWG